MIVRWLAGVYWPVSNVVLRSVLSPVECRERLTAAVESERVMRFGRLPRRGESYLFRGSVRLSTAEVRTWNLGRAGGYGQARLAWSGQRLGGTLVSVELRPYGPTLVVVGVQGSIFLGTAVATAIRVPGTWFVLPLALALVIAVLVPLLERAEARAIVAKLQGLLAAQAQPGVKLEHPL